MKKNVGSADRIIRLILAALVAVLYFTNIITGTLALIFSAVAAIFVLTSFVSFCPIYAALGLNSLQKKKDAAH